MKFRGKEINELSIDELKFAYKRAVESCQASEKKAMIEGKINEAFLSGLNPTHINYMKLHDKYSA